MKDACDAGMYRRYHKFVLRKLKEILDRCYFKGQKGKKK